MRRNTQSGQVTAAKDAVQKTAAELERTAKQMASTAILVASMLAVITRHNLLGELSEECAKREAQS